MKKGYIIILIILVLLVGAMVSLITNPILVVAEDTEEAGGMDMAAKFSINGFEWVYPGSSVNAEGQTLHNVHYDHPEDPYGAARDIITYSYGYTPHIIVSVNNEAAQAIFGDDIIDLIRSNDAYNGYAGNANVPGNMSRGDAMGTAMETNGMNVLQVPVQILLGNIRFIPV